MINYENLKNPDLVNEEILNIQDYIKSLESQNQKLTESNTTLQATNQRLFLRVSEPDNTPKVEDEKTPEQHFEELKEYLRKKVE